MQTTRKCYRGLLLVVLPLVVLALACNLRAAPPPTMTVAPLVSSPTALPPRSTPTLVVATPTATALPEETATPAPTGDDPRGIGDPYMPELGNRGYDVRRYTLRFTLDPATPYVMGETVIEAESTVDPLRELSLDFIGFEMTSLLVDGMPASYTRTDRKIIIDLPFGRLAGAPFTITVAYRGEPRPFHSPYIPAADSLGFVFPGDGSLFAFSEPDGARAWFPANDHPRDKATFRLELTVPTGLTAVANGELVETVDLDAQTRFVWEHNYPMATYLATVAVGNYVLRESVADNGVPLRSYLFPDAVAAFDAYAGINEAALAWMSALFGPYPFETYGYVTVNLPGVSMETQSLVLLSTQMIGRRTMVHEMAHMWFGDWVSLDSWGEMWRNEGFATYVQIMWENRDDPEGLELEMAGVAARVEENGNGYALSNPPPASLFGYETYFKGAMLAHALRQTVGDEAFFGGLRAYFARYGGGVASQAQFQAVMEEYAGISLTPFFAQWLP